MYLSKLHVANFRNFEDKLLSFSPDMTVIIGPNASGKTNILEALYLLSTGKSFKAKIEEEMITYGEEIGRVKALIKEGSDEVGEKEEKAVDTKLEAILTRGEISVGTTADKFKKTARKRLLINGIGKRLVDFSSVFKTVLFGPWDLDLVTESPSIRRTFLDNVLSQVDREYRRASLSYNKGLRQRNRLLLRIREEGMPRSQLIFWDRLLIKNGDYISGKREEFIEFVNGRNSLSGHTFSIEYDKSAISEARLEQYMNEEVAAATTLVGPHRDDFLIKISGHMGIKERDISRFGSRGEQRMGVLWIKLNELSFIEEKTGEKPTLLLDDIFSELDHKHRDIVADVAKNQQTIITTADPHYIENLKKVEKIEL